MSVRTEIVEGLRPVGRAPSGVLLAAGVVAVLPALAVLYLVIRASEADSGTWNLILRDRTAWLALRSLGLTAAVTAGAILLGVPLAWLVTRTDLPLRRVWTVVLALPLVIPSYVLAFTLLASFGPDGVLAGPAAALGIGRLPSIGGFPGAWLVLTLATYPYVFLTTAAGLRGIDPALEDAARSLGDDRARSFRRVTLPLLRPSIAAGALLAALYTLHDFGAVSLMRFPAFTQAIFLQYRAAFDRTPAAILSLMLVALALCVVWLERRSRGRARYYRSGSGTSRPPSRVALGRRRWVAVAGCLAVALVALGLPVAVLVFWAVRGITAGQRASLTLGAAGNSVLASAGGAVLAVAAALPVAALAARRRDAAASVVQGLAYTGFALPGIVIALSFVFLASGLPWLYQSVPLLVLAYVTLFLPQASEPIRGAFLQLSPSLPEAARSLGANGPRVFARLVAPLISRGAMTGFALVFLTAMKELPATLILRPTGFETLATEVWTAASVGRFGRGAVPALILVLISSVPLYFLTARQGTVPDVEEVRTT